jgi:hypothetical protein
MTYIRLGGLRCKANSFLVPDEKGSARETDRVLNCAGATLPAVSHDLGPSQEA